jgi:pimeloyl-ACP methyl ester carboxylesterase
MTSTATATAWVFLHGGQHGSWCWSALLAQMSAADRARTLLLDVPGCGLKRQRGDESPTLAEVVAELNAEVAAAGFGPAVLVGHSMAGSLLPLMVAAAPQRYRQVVYLAACVPRPGDSVMATMGGTVRGLDPAVVGWPMDPATTAPEALLRAMFGPGLEAHTLSHLLHEAVQDHWPMSLATAALPHDGQGLSVPADYIVTLQDPILPVAWQGRFAERAGARAMHQLDAPHEAFLSHPAALAALLARMAAPEPEP